jgi:hypothetical protein
MARGGHGLPKVLLGPALLDPSTPCGWATPETALRPFHGWLAFRAGSLCSFNSTTLSDTPRRTPTIPVILVPSWKNDLLCRYADCYLFPSVGYPNTMQNGDGVGTYQLYSYQVINVAKSDEDPNRNPLLTFSLQNFRNWVFEFYNMLLVSIGYTALVKKGSIAFISMMGSSMWMQF